jgi:hypothetical protein
MLGVNRPAVLLCLEVPLLALPTASVAVCGGCGREDLLQSRSVRGGRKTSPLPARRSIRQPTDHEREAVRELVQTMRKLL